MTNKEAIEILTHTRFILARRNGKTAYTEALNKAIGALKELDRQESKKQEIKARQKHKCRECANFCFGYGGLCETIGHCSLRDAPFTDNRPASNRACKDFITDGEANEDE